MAIGVEITLHDAAGVALASETGITALWWDEPDPADGTQPKGKATGLATNGSGVLKLDLSDVSWLATGDDGFLLLHKGDDTDYQDALVFASQIATSSVSGGTRLGPATWTRNPSWLSITAPSSSEEKIVGLHRVDPQSAYLAFNVQGKYTVDWGDGTAAEDVNSFVTAVHLYDYTDSNLNGTNAPVTLTDSGDVVGRTAHGYRNGMEVQFYNIVSTTGLVEGQTYYVINAAADTFQVSATKQGSAVTLTTDGTATLLPYKQVIVTITPQAAQNLTSVSFQYKHTASGLQAYASGWLDLAISVPNCTSLEIGGTTVRMGNLERAYIVAHNDTTLVNLFKNCFALQSVPLFNTASATSISAMFNACYLLQSVPLLDTSSVTNNMQNVFADCHSLESAPPFNTGGVTSMTGMFSNCYSLKSVPLLDTSSASTMNTMFSQCRSLQSVPQFNTASATNMNSIFAFCYALQSVPLLDTADVTDAGSMFSGCYSLALVPALDMSGATSASTYTNMFANCNNLSRIAATGFKYSFSVANCKLSAASLDELYGNLATVTSQTITVSNNVGTAGDDPTIATAKGWSVTG